VHSVPAVARTRRLRIGL